MHDQTYFYFITFFGIRLLFYKHVFTTQLTFFPTAKSYDRCLRRYYVSLYYFLFKFEAQLHWKKYHTAKTHGQNKN